LKPYLNAVFKAIEFPAGVSNLDTGLANVDRNALSHFLGKEKKTLETNGMNKRV